MREVLGKVLKKALPDDLEYTYEIPFGPDRELSYGLAVLYFADKG